MMEDIEGHISRFKEQQKEQYDQLLRDERLTSQEIVAFDKKFESWAQLGPAKVDLGTKNKPTKLSSHRDVTKDLPSEVAAFDRFVAGTGGVRGGWDDYDHGTFLKYRNRHKGKPTFIRELIGFLPTKTEEEIRHHEMWFQRYNDLNEEKKEAIQKWREKKEVEKETMMAQVAQSGSDEEEEEENVRQELLQQRIEEEKRERRGQLNKWKVEKELARAEEEERKLRQELEKACKQEEEKLKKEDMKKKVQEYQQYKDQEKEQRQYAQYVKAEIEAERKKAATREIHKFQERDIKAVKKKVAKEKVKQEQERERQKRIQSKLKAQNEGHISRDPSRLLEPTAGWNERLKDQSRSGGQVLHMQHRSVPSWRQGVS